MWKSSHCSHVLPLLQHPDHRNDGIYYCNRVHRWTFSSRVTCTHIQFRNESSREICPSTESVYNHIKMFRQNSIVFRLRLRYDGVRGRQWCFCQQLSHRYTHLYTHAMSYHYYYYYTTMMNIILSIIIISVHTLLILFICCMVHENMHVTFAKKEYQQHVLLFYFCMKMYIEIRGSPNVALVVVLVRSLHVM